MLIDPYKRPVTYLRVSVTDRCDFRCVYCMSENMTFLPKKDLLTLEELEFVCKTFISMGVSKIRLTGGEPLVRKNIMQLINNLGSEVGNSLEELTITTNGSQLSKMASELLNKGIMIRAIGDSVAFCPPMIITEQQLDELFDPVKKALDTTRDWAFAEGMLD